MITAIFVYLTQPLVVHRTHNGRHSRTVYELSEIPGAETALQLGTEWVESQLDEGEELIQTLIEPAGRNEEEDRPVFTLAVTTNSPGGGRTLPLSTEAMPTAVRNAILGVIATLEEHPVE